MQVIFRNWDLIEALQMSVQHLIYGLISCDLVKQYDSWLVGTTYLIWDSRGKQRGHSETVMKLCQQQDAFEPSEICGFSWGVFLFSMSSHVLLRCPCPVLNGQWQSTHDFGQHFTYCVFLEEIAPARQEQQKNFSVEVLPLISNWDWIRLD